MLKGGWPPHASAGCLRALSWQRERGTTVAAALAKRTKVFRTSLAAHWLFFQALGQHAPALAEALAQARLLRAFPGPLTLVQTKYPELDRMTNQYLTLLNPSGY